MIPRPRRNRCPAGVGGATSIPAGDGCHFRRAPELGIALSPDVYLLTSSGSASSASRSFTTCRMSASSLTRWRRPWREAAWRAARRSSNHPSALGVVARDVGAWSAAAPTYRRDDSISPLLTTPGARYRSMIVRLSTARHAKAMRLGKFALINPVDDVHARTLRGEDNVDPSARLLRHIASGVSTLPLHRHHEVRHSSSMTITMYGWMPGAVRPVSNATSGRFGRSSEPVHDPRGVELLDVPRAVGREEVIAIVHPITAHLRSDAASRLSVTTR